MPSKYGNKKQEAYGRVWDSKRELACYEDLLLKEKAGIVRNIQTQVKYQLCVVAQGGPGGAFSTYTADFVYQEWKHVPPVVKRGKVLTPGTMDWVDVVADAKGYANDRWPMKKKAMWLQYGVKVLEL